MKNFHSVCLGVLTLALATNACAQRPENLPDEFKQIVPRGRIGTITNPTYVPASEAEIDDDAWVFGVVVAGQARAYSLNLLNRHEVVNDKIGDLNFAAVW